MNIKSNSPALSRSGCLLWIIIVLTIYILASCKTTKHIEKNKEITETEIKTDSSSYYKHRFDSTFRLLIIERRRKTTGIEFREPKPTNNGCPVCPVNEIEVTKTGTIKAKGNISNFNQDINEYLQKIEELNVQVEDEINKRISAEEKNKKLSEVKNIDVEKKTGYGFLVWILTAIAFIIGYFIAARYHSKIKKLFGLLILIFVSNSAFSQSSGFFEGGNKWYLNKDSTFLIYDSNKSDTVIFCEKILITDGRKGEILKTDYIMRINYSWYLFENKTTGFWFWKKVDYVKRQVNINKISYDGETWNNF